MSRTQRPSEGRTNGADKVPAVNKAIAIVPLSQPRLLERRLAQRDRQQPRDHQEPLPQHPEDARRNEGWLTYDAERRSYSLAPRLLTDVSRLIARQSPSAAHPRRAGTAFARHAIAVRPDARRAGRQLRRHRQGRGSGGADRICADRPPLPPDAPAQMRVRLAWMPEDLRRQELRAGGPAPTQARPSSRSGSSPRSRRPAGEATPSAGRNSPPGVMTLAVPIFDTFGDVQWCCSAPA